MGTRLPLRFASALVALALASCHLADDFDAKKCEPGTHAENGRCVDDPGTGPTFTITESGGSCSVSPDSLTVSLTGEFGFYNTGTVDRVITGDDGQAWATAPSGRNSPLIKFTKTGTFGFHVSGCPAGGRVVVE